MFFFLRYTTICAIAVFSSVIHAQNSTSKFGKASISSIIKAMTLEEKAALVVGTGMRFEGKGAVIGSADGKVPGAAGNTMSIDRLGVPGTVLSDGPAGVRIDPFRGADHLKSYYATAWPSGILLASSWDTNLVRKVGVAFGNEVKEYGVDVILAPGVNIQRNPLGGRNFEYYSEDPLVAGQIATAMINGIQSNGVGTSLKHFAANNQETNRNFINSIVSERALREIYLKGFEIAIKNSQPWTVMSSYNKLNGTYTSESYDLLTTILRKEWGFKGYVMTDWAAGRNRVAQMKAGNDLIEPGSKVQMKSIIDAVINGTLDVKVLDQNVERILTVVLKTPSYQNYKYSDSPDLKAHAVIARNAAAESMVLLKNGTNVLPLSKGLKLALFGNASYETIIGGTGSGQVNIASSVSIVEGLTNAGYFPYQDLKSKYKEYIQQDKLDHPKLASLTLGTPRMTPELEFNLGDIEKSATTTDIAIFTIGRNAGEGGDRKVEGDFNLSEQEKSSIKNIANAFHAQGKKIVVVLNIGGPIETASWKDNVDAILLAWQPGIEAGNAITDILSGTINPSGKLAITFPMKYEDVPSSKSFPGTPVEYPEEVVYEEGIYVGYRYFNSFGVKTSYPFGFGLSYASFSYGNLKLSSSSFKDEIKASVTIKNTGKVSGKEVVQLYLSAPSKSLDKPSEELKGFAKTTLLKPGASQTITFTLTKRDLASFDTTQTAWIAEGGNYNLKIGASCEDSKLVKSFVLEKDLLVEKVNKVLVPQRSINELKRPAR